MWLNEGLQCTAKTGFNCSGQCDNSHEQQQNNLQDHYVMTITTTDSSCKNCSFFSVAILGIAWVFLTGGILLSFFFLVFTIHFRKTRIVKMSSPNLNIITLLGSGLTYGSAYLFGIEKQNLSKPSMEMLVQMRISLLCIGGSLAFGPVLGKSWRLYKVFTQQIPDKRVVIKDFQLLVMVSVLVLTDIILLFMWMSLDPVQCLQSLHTDLKLTERGLTCQGSQGFFCSSLYSDLWLILLLGFKGSLLMHGAYLAGLTANLSCPPVNQSLTLIVGTVIIFLSTGIILVVNRFFHLWHNLVFGFYSGGIFVSTSTINCLIFVPQIKQWKAFEKEKSDISNMAKYFNSTSKNIRSTMYSDEEIYQLLGEKNSMMQQLAEKDVAIANLQEQMNSTKAKLLRLVAVEENCSTADSAFLSASHSLYAHLTANCSSKGPETMPGDPFLSDQELNSCQYPRLSDSECRPTLFGKKDCSEYTKQQITPPETAVDDTEDDQDLYTSPQASLFQKQLPGTGYVSSEKLQEILQDLRTTDHTVVTQVSPRGPKQNVNRQRYTERKPQEIQTHCGLYSAREKNCPIWLHNSTPSSVWCNVKKTANRSFSDLTGFPEAAADDMQDKNPLQQLTSLSSLMPHKTSGGYGWLFDKHQENCLSTLHPRSFKKLHQDLLADAVLGIYSDSDSDSSSSSSERKSYCHHKRCSEVSSCSLSYSSDISTITDADLEQGMALHCATFYGKPQPVVNFNEDLESIYV